MSVNISLVVNKIVVLFFENAYNEPEDSKI